VIIGAKVLRVLRLFVSIPRARPCRRGQRHWCVQASNILISVTKKRNYRVHRVLCFATNFTQIGCWRWCTTHHWPTAWPGDDDILLTATAAVWDRTVAKCELRVKLGAHCTLAFFCMLAGHSLTRIGKCARNLTRPTKQTGLHLLASVRHSQFWISIDKAQATTNCELGIASVGSDTLTIGLCWRCFPFKSVYDVTISQLFDQSPCQFNWRRTW